MMMPSTSERMVILAFSATFSNWSGLGVSPRLAIRGSISDSGTPRMRRFSAEVA